MNRPIAFLTDFGLEDHYVGSIKAVTLGINPKAVMFDIGHDIRPQNIQQGAFVLRAVYPYLPKGTVVVAVVDPGVGSKRHPLCIKTSKGYLIGPDNGLFSWALQFEKTYEARVIENRRYFLNQISQTFHGRDIFSPVAAHLSTSNIFARLGPKLKKIITLPFPTVRRTAKGVEGEIVYMDRFGNALTNIVCHAELKRVQVGQKEAQLVERFSDGKPGALMAIWNSTDFLELAVKNDSAEKLYRLKLKDKVTLS